MSSYGADLATIHDAGYSGFAEAAARGIADLLCDLGIIGGHVVELGCGSGVVARYLSRRGFQVTGIEQSKDFLRIARSRPGPARFRVGSWHDCAIPQCDAVLAVGEVLNYDFGVAGDALGHWDRLVMLFGRVARALSPGGAFIFDFLGDGQIEAGQVRLSHRVGVDWACMARSTEDRDTRTLTREITAFRQRGRNYRRSDETHIQRLHSLDSVAGALVRAGFVVEQRTALSDVRLGQASAWFLCQKR